ncbi:MAG: glycosyltransferase family 8 protein [Rhizobiaceae bacterium]|nr:glycosyltransferase family 8 protein [Rhizobiaceae bacterium]
MSDSLHISLAVDHGFEVPLGVCIRSIAETQAGLDCRVAVLCSGLDLETRRKIESDAEGKLTIDWIEVDPARLTGANFTLGLSSAALFRILLPEILPGLSKTLYIDADTVVCGSLSDLWNTRLGDNFLAAVRDAGAPFPAGPAGTDWKELGLEPDMPYFNSGVMLLALDKWREQGFGNKTLDLLRARKMPWGDQDALNIAARGKWSELPRKWNLQTADAEGKSLSWALWRADVETAIEAPAIIHYTGYRKPWNGKQGHPYADRWFQTLARTRWAGWEVEQPSAIVRIGRRLGRAASVLAHG